jgi:hypothetical protein
MFVAADTAMLRTLRVPYGRGRVVAVVAALATLSIGLASTAAQVAALAVIVGLASGRPRGDSATPTAR